MNMTLPTVGRSSNSAKRRTARRQRRSSRRVGAALILVMTCLMIVTSLTFAMVKSTLLSVQRIRLEQAALQADWLLFAGEERAHQQLLSDANYLGEQWAVPLSVGGEPVELPIEIQVQATDDVKLKLVTLKVTMTATRGQSVVRSKSIQIRLQDPLKGEST
ncbi:MAG: general secretion pathway protein GspK [Planctomycetales bacterium]|nr:general secretion pathway protein GspK [Planctomycetales bacterium]